MEASYYYYIIIIIIIINNNNNYYYYYYFISYQVPWEHPGKMEIGVGVGGGEVREM